MKLGIILAIDITSEAVVMLGCHLFMALHIFYGLENLAAFWECTFDHVGD